ncbi:MAG: DUF1844 domain-containing protein [Bdellovibrionales bacterium]
MSPNQPENIEASFSTLVLSIGSSAAIALGLSPNPANGKIEKDNHLARFNIDLLSMLQDKTKNNLNDEEKKFLDFMVSDLQMRFVQCTK